MLLLRHARAGDREAWTGDDRLRPLDAKGRRRAEELVVRLAGRAIDEIHTSPALRCVQTVAAIADARGIELRLRDELTEEEQWERGAAVVRGLAGRDVLVCGHGGLEQALDDPPKWRKGAVFVLDASLRVVDEL